MRNSCSCSFSYSNVGSSNSSTTTTSISILHRILNVVSGLTIESHTKDAIEDAIAADVIPVDELIAMNAEYTDSHGKAFGILKSISGIISVISSSIFIWMILRSHHRLSTTQHRLLLGLCIFDIILSSCWSTFNAMAPSDNDYWVWNARGNQDTCNVQGFLVMVGVLGGLFYNTSLNLYFLAVVKYKKSEQFICVKIEPFLHGVPIAVALSYSIYRLVKKQLNDDDAGTCVSPINDAPHCIGYDFGEIREGFDIPCWRGAEGAVTAFISQMILTIIPIFIMMVSLGMIYSAVRKQEKKLARYGIGSLGFNLQPQSVSTQQQWRMELDKESGVWGRFTLSLTALSTFLKSKTRPCKKKTKKHIIKSNGSTQSQSHSVMHKAFGYTFAWFLSWGFYMIGLIIQLSTGLYPLVLIYLASIICPLQGLFNLLIFMHPKIMAAKKSKKQGGETVSWRQAFSTAFWSRGKGGKNRGTIRSNLRGGTSNGRPKKTKNKDTATDKKKAPMFGRVENQRADTPQEEEKCEIQVPDNLNPSRTKVTSTATYASNIVSFSTDTTLHFSQREGTGKYINKESLYQG